MTSALLPTPAPTRPTTTLARRFIKGQITRPVAIAAIAVTGLIAQAVLHHAFSDKPFWPSGYGMVLAIHVTTVIPTVPLGAWLLLQPKGGARHRLLGRIWALLMLITAFTSFGIARLTGGFSPIHLLSILTIVSVVRGVHFARSGDIPRHRRSMVLAFTGIVTASAFTLLPGRLLGLWLLG